MVRVLLMIAVLLLSASARADGRYASVIVDADSQTILHARQIDAPRHPASLTKIMTLYLVFDAVESGRLSLSDTISVSAQAARTPPVKMGLKAGQKVTVDTLVQAVAVRSANDAAVVLAEALAGSESAFAARMTDQARLLGMRNTVFRNASGLPDDAQLTTARDMAKLAHATLERFPQHYHYFGQDSFRGARSTNALLGEAGVDGFKTGYTRASGYNLVISAARDLEGVERRLIAVVLGGASKGSRNSHMRDLVERGFDVMGQGRRVVRREPVAPQPPQPVMAAHGTDGPWAVQIGAFRSPAAAEIAAGTLQRAARGGRIVARSGFAAGQPVHSARVEGLSQQAAHALCANHAELLAIPARRCLVLYTANAGP